MVNTEPIRSEPKSDRVRFGEGRGDGEGGSAQSLVCMMACWGGELMPSRQCPRPYSGFRVFQSLGFTGLGFGGHSQNAGKSVQGMLQHHPAPQ